MAANKLWGEQLANLALLDDNFLIALLEHHNREIYARIASLDINGLPIEYIEGKVTGGSINVDGDSIVRRTCNLTLVAQDVKFNDYYWGLRTKFKLEIGVKNELTGKYSAASGQYPEIVWFPQGVFIISSFNTSLSVNNYTISITGKDKMCMLNGELGGQIFASVDFGREEKEVVTYQPFATGTADLNADDLTAHKYYIQDNDDYKVIYNLSDISNDRQIFVKESTYVFEENTLEKIIRESVHTYAGEPYHNIIINDLDEAGLEQLTYNGDEPIIVLQKSDDSSSQVQYILASNFPNDFCVDFEITVDDAKTVIAKKKNSNEEISSLICPLSDLNNNHNSYKVIHYDQDNMEYFLESPNESENIIDYYISVISYGEDLGYRITDLTYAGKLISNIGETLTSILDKIKQMLGDFEYFYNLEGQFVFQRKKTYINTSWSLIQDNNYVNYANSESKFSFNFEGNNLVVSLQNNPQLNNVRNDYTVWGKRTSITGVETLIHARYAIDKKPKKYTNFKNVTYYAIGEKSSLEEDEEEVDWRELIYQMALDYFAAQGASPTKSVQAGDMTLHSPDLMFAAIAKLNPEEYPLGITGYEQYYTDMQGFWRQIYYPHYRPEIVYSRVDNNLIPVKININYYITNEDNTQSELEDLFDNEQRYILQDDDDKDLLWWNVALTEAPETLNFWIDFFDDGEDLSSFSVSQIGIRSKVVNEDKASAIIFPTIPDVILNDVENDTTDLATIKTGYTWLNLPAGFSQFLTISSRSLSVKDKIDTLLYQHGYCAQSLSMTTLPVYHLQPNTRIYVSDTKTGINGEYVVNKITIPLTYNGTMSISATLVPERIY